MKTLAKPRNVKAFIGGKEVVEKDTWQEQANISGVTYVAYDAYGKEIFRVSPKEDKRG